MREVLCCKNNNVLTFYNWCYVLLFKAVLKPTTENKQGLSLVSRQVANAVTELVQSAEAIKGTEILPNFLCFF